MLLFLAWWLAVASGVRAAVLDPALYLSPSPPLTGNPAAVEHWSKAADLGVQPTDEANVVVEQESTEELVAPQARTFWPIQPVQPTNYGIRGLHIPLTFSLTGSYGSNTGISSGVIGSSYASVSDDGFNYGKSGLAGSSYGLYRSGLPGTRIYGGGSGATWSGWGNGKWGHYGKG